MAAADDRWPHGPLAAATGGAAAPRGRAGRAAGHAQGAPHRLRGYGYGLIYIGIFIL